jgi:hypothetical protein
MYCNIVTVGERGAGHGKLANRVSIRNGAFEYSADEPATFAGATNTVRNTFIHSITCVHSIDSFR